MEREQMKEQKEEREYDIPDEFFAVEEKEENNYMDERLKEYLEKQIKKHQDDMEAEVSLIKMFKDAKKVAASKEKVDQVMSEYAQVTKGIHGDLLYHLRTEIKLADNWEKIAHETLDQQIDQRYVFLACHAWALQELSWIRDEAYLLDEE